jgi:hypothetical protein
VSELTAVELIRRAAIEWATPRHGTKPEGERGLRMTCRVQPPFANGAPDEPPNIPHDLRAVWRETGGAALFLDPDYGQWGMTIFMPEGAAKATAEYLRLRPRHAIKGDLIIAEFRGDSDLVLLRTDPDASDLGEIWIVDPIYPRKQWERAASSFTELIARFIAAEGEKYWDRSGR